MTDKLDRLLELRRKSIDFLDDDSKLAKEYDTLKSEINAQLENWDKYGKDYGFRIQTLSNDKKELESKVAKLEKELETRTKEYEYACDLSIKLVTESKER